MTASSDSLVLAPCPGLHLRTQGGGLVSMLLLFIPLHPGAVNVINICI